MSAGAISIEADDAPVLPTAFLRVGGEVVVWAVEADRGDLAADTYLRTVDRLHQRDPDGHIAVRLDRFPFQRPRLGPHAILLHVARCGSTLLSRMLDARRDTLSIRESPIIGVGLVDQLDDEQLRQAVATHFDVRTDDERYAVLKFGHQMHERWQRLRQVFPATRLVLLSRDPRHVVASLLEAPSPVIAHQDERNRPAFVLDMVDEVLVAMLAVLERDELVVALDYEDLVDPTKLPAIVDALGLPTDDEERTRMRDALLWDAKSDEATAFTPTERPDPRTLPHVDTHQLDGVIARYEQLRAHPRFGLRPT